MKKQTISNGMKTQLIQTTKTIILALILTLGISYVMAWTGPTSTPPDGNTPAPVNVGTTDQVKNGGLGINALSVFGTGYVEKLKINETGDTGAWELYTDGDTYTSGTLRTDGILQANNGISVDGNTVIDDGAGWHRTYGNTGWINQTYGGGWYMTDTTWLRSYANKSFILLGQ